MDQPPDNDKWRGLSLVSASGLDESQIVPEDIAELNALFSPNEIALSFDPATSLMELEEHQPRLTQSAIPVPIGIPEPRPLRVKVEPLPKRPKLRRLAIKAPRIRYLKNLPACMSQPIRRNRLRLSMLTESEQENMSLALKKKFGDEADGMYMVAAFANIPPESAQTITVDSELRYATFVPVGRSKNQTGFFLLILETKQNQTEKVLVRL